MLRRLLIAPHFLAVHHEPDDLAPHATKEHVVAWPPIVVFIHLAYPGVQYTDTGKTNVCLPDEIGSSLDTLLAQVTSDWTKQRRKELKSDQARERREEALTRKNRTAVKEAAYAVMEKAFEEAARDPVTGKLTPVESRQVMYKCRGEIISEAKVKTISGAYFAKLLRDYMEDHPNDTKDWNVIYQPRGKLIEPHTNRGVELGTDGVGSYFDNINRGVECAFRPDTCSAMFPTLGPSNRFAAVMVVEKEGFWPHFKSAQLAERRDLAIMSSKGQNTVAARTMADQLGIPVFVLHDFDIAGFSILGTLRSNNNRYKFINEVEVIDIGVRLTDVGEFSLESETVHISKTKLEADRRNLARHGATPDEIDYLCSGKRVEINAFSTPQLIAFIERALDKRGITKVVPNGKVLELQYRRAAEINYFTANMAEAQRVAKAHAAALQLPSDLKAKVQKMLAAAPELPWDAAVADCAGESV